MEVKQEGRQEARQEARQAGPNSKEARASTANGHASGIEIDSRQTQTSQYCAADGVCYSQYTVPTSNITYRIAIPDVSNAPFDVLLQITAPVAVGWAGLAWGGVMAKNPLTVAWPNGDSAIISSRWAT